MTKAAASTPVLPPLTSEYHTYYFAKIKIPTAKNLKVTLITAIWCPGQLV